MDMVGLDEGPVRDEATTGRSRQLSVEAAGCTPQHLGIHRLQQIKKGQHGQFLGLGATACGSTDQGWPDRNRGSQLVRLSLGVRQNNSQNNRPDCRLMRTLMLSTADPDERVALIDFRMGS
jgi:hypothetical protein